MEKGTQRSTAELVRELEAEAPKFQDVALVLSATKAEDHAQVVFHSDGTAKQKLEKLNALFRRGHLPVALVGWTNIMGTFTLYSRLLEEFVSDPEAAEFLDRFTEGMKQYFAKLPGCNIVSDGEGWVN